jgi:hypothetical protein
MLSVVCAGCRVVFIVMLSVIMLNAVILGVSSKVLVSECHSALHHLSKRYSKYHFVGCHFPTSHL